jgi:hypothetical protein
MHQNEFTNWGREPRAQATLLKSKLICLQITMNYFEAIKECREHGFAVFAFLLYYHFFTHNAVAGSNKNQICGRPRLI